jgi:PiT family inorganic phosphate transporter
MNSELILNYFIFIIGIVASFLVGGNNSAIALGILLSTNVLKKRTSYLVNTISLFVGATIGSITMEGSFSGVISSTRLLILILSISILFASTVTFYYLNKIGIPASLSQMIYPSMAGIVLIARGVIGFDWGKFFLTVSSWVISPLVAIATSLAMYYFLLRVIKKERNFIKEIKYYKVALISASIFTSFVTGANAIGIIISAGLIAEPFYITAPIYGLASALGIYLSSRKAAITVGFRITKLGYTGASSALIGSDIISEVFTILGIPISITQTIMGGIIGLSFRSFGYDVRKQLKQVAKGWVVSPILALIVSLASYGVIRSILGL